MERDKKADEELKRIRKKKLNQMMNESKNHTDTKRSKLKPGENLIQLNATNFWDVIKQNEKVIVDFYADWCGPCKMIEPIFTQLAKKYIHIVFGRLNVDYAPKIAAHFQIHAIPLLLFFRQAQLQNKLLGLQSSDTIEASIQKLNAD